MLVASTLTWLRLSDQAPQEQAGHPVRSSSPPPRSGYFSTLPPSDAVRASLASVPRASSYAAKWHTWLRPRVTGAHVGTTDENIQWAACKWGISDNVLRAIAVRESTWTQYDTYRSGRCVLKMAVAT